ncbi:hypothetical protein QL285_039121 [Trifolium repens]|nr:hypothetical protein QL285_039121 [Trifolium repens]
MISSRKLTLELVNSADNSSSFTSMSFNLINLFTVLSLWHKIFSGIIMEVRLDSSIFLELNLISLSYNSFQLSFNSLHVFRQPSSWGSGLEVVSEKFLKMASTSSAQNYPCL